MTAKVKSAAKRAVDLLLYRGKWTILPSLREECETVAADLLHEDRERARMETFVRWLASPRSRYNATEVHLKACRIVAKLKGKS